MDRETYEALKLLMDKLDRHVIHATYQEDAMKAYKQVETWLDEVSKDYNEYCEIHPNQALEIKKDGWKYCPICGE